MPVEIAASSVGPKTAHAYVKDSLRQAILRGAIPGGSRLVQADVARDLKVSTTPVREALRDLATEGLIRLDPHRGAIVHRLSYDETREVHDICKLLEPEAMRQAAKCITPETMAEARALAQRMNSESDPGRWADLNRQFHGVLIQDISSKYLLDILRTLRDTAAMYVGLAISHRPIQMQEGNHQHDEFLDAMERGDAATAAKLSRVHLDLTLRTLEASRHLLES
jgi:DNA-binding GntR family transcriptional regulator